MPTMESFNTDTPNFDEPAINWHNEVHELDAPARTPEEAPRNQRSNSQSDEADLTRFVRHPWGLIDYYLYLTAMERGRDWETRIDESMLLEDDGFYHVGFGDLCKVEEVFSHVPQGTDPMMFFVSLPVPNNVNEFSGRRLFLGFDLGKHRLLGYLFESASADIRDMFDEWEHGQLVIDLNVHRFVDLLEYSVEHRPEILQIGILHYFRETTRVVPVGLDLVVIIQFAQFLDDFADLLWLDSPDLFRKEYKHLEEDLRRMLQRASYESWFGSRKGMTVGQYRRHKLQDFVSSELLFCNQRTVPVVRVEAPRFDSSARTAAASAAAAVRPAPTKYWMVRRRHWKLFVVMAAFVLFPLLMKQMRLFGWKNQRG